MKPFVVVVVLVIVVVDSKAKREEKEEQRARETSVAPWPPCPRSLPPAALPPPPWRSKHRAAASIISNLAYPCLCPRVDVRVGATSATSQK